MRTMFFVAAVAAMLAAPAVQAQTQPAETRPPAHAHDARDRGVRDGAGSPDRRTYRQHVERERALHPRRDGGEAARQLPPTPESIARGNGYADRMGAAVRVHRYGYRAGVVGHRAWGYGRTATGPAYRHGYRPYAVRGIAAPLHGHRHWVGHHRHGHGYWAGRVAVRSAYWPRRAGYWHGYRAYYPAARYSVAPSYPVEQDYGYAAPAEAYPVAPAPALGTGCGCQHGW